MVSQYPRHSAFEKQIALLRMHVQSYIQSDLYAVPVSPGRSRAITTSHSVVPPSPPLHELLLSPGKLKVALFRMMLK